MDALKQRMEALRIDKEKLTDERDTAVAKAKELEQAVLEKDQEIVSLKHNNTLLETDVEKLETELKEAKKNALEGAQHGTTSENLQRKVTILEEEAEKMEQQLKETTEKLRLTDVKAEHYERKVTSLEATAEAAEKKYEEMEAKYKAAQAEIQEMVKALDTI